MTEKRFTHKDKSLYIDDDYFCELEDGDEITELLNRQQYTVETVWKENEQLKEETILLKRELDDASKLLDELTIPELLELVKSLNEENQVLKKENERLKKRKPVENIYKVF